MNEDTDRKFPLIADIARSALVGGGGRRCLNRDQETEQEKLASTFGDMVPQRGILLPFFESRAGNPMSATGTTSVTLDQGGMTIATSIPEVGAALRAGIVLPQLGARVLSGLTENINLPRGDPAIVSVWAAENASSTDEGSLFATLPLKPLRVTAYLTVSIQLLKQAVGIESWLRTELMNALGVEIQRVAVNGSGVSNQPTGILATSGIGSVVGGTNGAVPTLANFADLEYAVNGTAATDRGHCAWITSPWVRRKARQLFQNGTGSESIWSSDSANSLFGHPAAVTVASPDNLTKGTSSGVCSAIIFGELSELVFGFWGQGIAVEGVTSVALGTNSQMLLVATAYVNVGVRSPKAFAAMLDALAA